MKILVVTDFILGDDYGGSARVIDEYIEELISRGHRVYILTFSKRKNLQKIEVRKNTLIYRLYKKSWWLLIGIYVYNWLIYRFKIDAVILNAPFSAMSTFLSLRKLPKLYVFHSPWCEEYYINVNKKDFGYVLRKIIEKFALEKSKFVLCYSYFMRDKLLSLHKIKPQKVNVAYAGVNTKKFFPEDKFKIRTQLGLPLDKFIIFTARRFVPRMGLENLLFAMKKVVENYNDVLLILAGDGPLKDKLENIVKNLNLNQWVLFVGYLSEDLVKYYQAADIFVLPTKQLEGFGMVTVESLACGTPVLGTPVGGTVEILARFDKKCLFEDTTAESIAKGILEIIYDRVKFAQLKNKCVSFVRENFSWQNFVDKMEELIKKK